jgi:hypothetical protein
VLKYLFFDTNYRVTNPDSSFFKVLSYHNIKKDEYLRKPRFNDYDYIIKSHLNKTSDSFPQLLDGSLEYFNKANDKIQFEEYYENGILKKLTEHLYELEDTLTKKHYHDVYYFDSLKNNKTGTFLIYEFRGGEPESKYYCCDDKPKDKIYLQEHKRFYSRFKPRIGYSYQNRDFLEYGITREHLSGAKLKTKSITYDSPNFMAYSLSLMNSFKKGENLFGQRFTLSYIATIIRTDIGIMHISNFKDSYYRTFAGVGFTVLGRLNIMYHYTFSLNNTHIPNLANHTLTLSIF